MIPHSTFRLTLRRVCIPTSDFLFEVPLISCPGWPLAGGRTGAGVSLGLVPTPISASARPARWGSSQMWTLRLIQAGKSTGCPKKTLFSGILAITWLWKVLELKVGGVLKTSGNSLCDRHKNFPNWPFRSWENWVQRWQLNLKKSWKKLRKFFWIELIFFSYPVPNTLNLCLTRSKDSTWYLKCGF